MSVRAVFLEMDGTLVEHAHGPGAPGKLKLRSGVGAALRLLSHLDYRLFAVSSQARLANGQLDDGAAQAAEHRLADLLFREQLTLAGYYFCPHHPDGRVAQPALSCLCRKPLPGMLIEAARDHDIDLQESWMVGDVLHDIEAGNRAGCRTVLVDSGNETQWHLNRLRLPTRVVGDIYAAALIIADDEGQW